MGDVNAKRWMEMMMAALPEELIEHMASGKLTSTAAHEFAVNGIVAQQAENTRLRARVAELEALLDRCVPQLSCLHSLINDNLDGAAAEKVVHDLVGDICTALREKQAHRPREGDDNG